jgi:alanyl aminopeptidase
VKFIKIFLGFAALTLGLTACGPQNTDTVSPVSEPIDIVSIVDENAVPHAQLGDNVIPLRYRLDFSIDPRQDTFSGFVNIDVMVKEPTKKIWLHGKNMNVTNAKAILSDASEVAAEYIQIDPLEAPSGIASLNFDTEVGPGKVVLIIPYSKPYNTALNSAYKVERKSGDQTDSYIVTQFEAIGAREAFPSFDEPRFKVPFSVTISAPSEDFVYANTPETKSIKRGDGWTRHVFEKTRPLPTYLLAFGVGPWDVVEYDPLPPTNVRKRPIPLRGIAARGEGKRFEYALKNTAGILEALEEYFGIPYPYEKLDLIAAPEYAFGAMENPGAIVYTEYLLLMSETASLNQKRSYARVHAHELAHQWFGDLVTPVWWEDIWLNEAFATWMGNKATDLWQPEGNFDRSTLNASLGAMRLDTLASTRKVREPLARTENVMDQFDSITYRKGGGVLSMFESYLGEDRFQKGVRLHMERFEDDVASGDDFFQSLADGSGDAKVVSAMKSFVDQPGLPLVSAELNCDGNVHELKLLQSRYAPLGSTVTQGQTWEIPVCARYSADGEIKKSCTLLENKRQTMKLESQSCPAWVTANADGAGYYRFSLDAAGWQNLVDNLDDLNPREVLTVLDSLKAAFRAGKVDAAVYLSGLEAFAMHKEYDIANRAGSGIASMHSALLPKTARDDLARFTRDLYTDRYARIKDAESVESNLLAPTLANRLTYYGGDSELGESFAQKGAVYLGLDGTADKKALASKFRTLGLAQVFENRPEESLPALMELLKNGSPAEKSSALSAIGSTEDSAIAGNLREQALSDKDAFTNRQASGVVVRLMGNEGTKDETWDWFKENFDAFVENRVLDVRKGGVPGYARGFCSKDRAVEVEAFFESKAPLIPGYERSLAQTLESINLCVALKNAKSTEMANALAAR